MLKVYIGGKITGDKHYKEKFWRAANQLSAAGFIVLNPAEIPEGMTKENYMQICLQMIFAADVCIFLKDFEESTGAMIEMQLCDYIGKEYFLL